MFKQINIFIFVLVYAFSASAEHFTTSSPGVREKIEALGRGKTVKFAVSGGEIRELLITDYGVDQNGRFFVSAEDTTDGLILKRSDSKIVYEGDGDYSKGKGKLKVTENENLNGADRGAGVEAGILSVVQDVIVSGSSAARAIDKAYHDLVTAHAQINKDRAAVRKAEIDLRTGILTLGDQIGKYVRSPVVGLRKGNVGVGSNIDVFGGGDSALRKYSFKSSDRSFRNRENEIRDQILSSPGNTSRKQEVKQIGAEALIGADQAHVTNDREQAEFLIDLAKAAADVLIGLDPVTGTFRNGYEFITGKNLITQVPLTAAERIIAGVGLATFAYTTDAWKIHKWIKPISAKVGPLFMKSYIAVGQFLKRIGQGERLVEETNPIRKINLFSNKSPKHGFTFDHLQKHLYDPDPENLLALRNIDPKGNADIWMNNIAHAAQSPATAIEPGGILRIKNIYSKSDGSGTYKLGVRLEVREDGSYDLLTILTGQLKN